MDSTDINVKEFDYEKLKIQGTGGHELVSNYKTIIYPFDKYQIKVKLTLTNEFIGITEVKLDKDFLSFNQKIGSKGIHDIDKFYRE